MRARHSVKEGFGKGFSRRRSLDFSEEVRAIR